VDWLNAPTTNIVVALSRAGGDAMTRAEDLVEAGNERGELERLTDGELLATALREGLIIQIVLHREIQSQAEMLVGTMPMELGVLLKALAASLQASTDAYEQVRGFRQGAKQRRGTNIRFVRRHAGPRRRPLIPPNDATGCYALF